MNPSFDIFSRDSLHYRTVPVTEVFHSDTLTPIQMFASLKNEAVFLLESKAFHDPSIRYSFIGLNPFFEMEEKSGRFLLKDLTFHTISESRSLKEGVQSISDKLKVKTPDLPVPFTGGGVGYVSYEAVTDFEQIILKPSADQPRYHFLFCETILVFDHLEQSVTIIHFVRINSEKNDGTLREIYDDARTKIEGIKRRIQIRINVDDLMLYPEDYDPESLNMQSNYEKSDFIKDVEKIKAYIHAGDIFQAVLSQRFRKRVSISGFELYRVLRQVNPSPYLFYLNYRNREVVGSSPERFIQVSHGLIEMHPIAGTRRRGKSRDEDDRIAKQLLADEKERAEHYMLVDLARNDVGKVSEFGSVHVPEQLQINYFSHVMHIVSKVRGTLRSDLHPIDAFVAAFPAGTLTGAPKIRAMEIIEELEPQARGVYGGAIVYFGFDGNIDSCITIRTATIQDQVIHIQAGAGIVADSDPEKEYQETINKANGLFYSVLLAEQSQLKRV